MYTFRTKIRFKNLLSFTLKLLDDKKQKFTFLLNLISSTISIIYLSQHCTVKGYQHVLIYSICTPENKVNITSTVIWSSGPAVNVWFLIVLWSYHRIDWIYYDKLHEHKCLSTQGITKYLHVDLILYSSLAEKGASAEKILAFNSFIQKKH